MICGLCGWCLECFWTGLSSIKKWKKNDRTLSCRTSIWMFPIYGMAACLSPICTKLEKRNALLRGGVYAVLIYLAEYSTGVLLKKYKACPWDQLITLGQKYRMMVVSFLLVDTLLNVYVTLIVVQPFHHVTALFQTIQICCQLPTLQFSEKES